MLTLRVLARGDILVLDARFAMETRTRRYIGRKTVQAWKLEELPSDCPRHEQANEFLQPGDQAIPHAAYPRDSVPATVLADAYHIRAVMRGELWPADKATADYCRVPFDPKFGGEHPALTKKGE